MALGACSPVKAPVTPKPITAKPTERPLEEGLMALGASDYSAAEAYFERARAEDDSEGALIGLAEVYLATGRYGAVDAVLEGMGGRAVALSVRALWLRGRLHDALRKLDAAAPVLLTERFEVAVMKAEILGELGKKPEADDALHPVIEAANRGEIERLVPAEQKVALLHLGRAAHLLSSPADANGAYDDAEQLGDPSARLLEARALLYLEKHDLAHAMEVLEEALEKEPNNPNLLALLADARLTEALSFAEAEALAGAALAVNPAHARAHLVLGSIALYDLDIPAADRHIGAALATNPRDLDLLALRAAKHFIIEDRAGFDREMDRILELSPGRAAAFVRVSRHAEWEHRYQEMEALLRRATRLDRDHAESRSMLGLTLVRSGSDAAGVVELRRAFELDPYDVRVINTLDLYEKLIPKNYVEERLGPLSLRFPKDEAPLLRRYVPALLEEAYRQMVDRYGYEPRAPLGIELYVSREEFAVRTSGLPRTAIQGVCFGRKLATMSPAGSEGNLGMTLWHELAHVFHIGQSESRVPRWLTEGMAEWETEHLGRGWSRELDRQLYQAHRDHRLPPLETMARAFSRARRMEDVAVAYYASGRVVRSLVEEHGEKVLPTMLGELGKKLPPGEAVPRALGQSYADLDAAFGKWLDRDLSRFGGQFVSRDVTVPLGEARRRYDGAPTDPNVMLDYALALLAAGGADEAEPLLTKLTEKTPNPDAAYALARLRLAQGERGRAAEVLRRALEVADGYELRLLLGRVLVGDADTTTSKDTILEAHAHLRKAAELDPSELEPWMLLARVGVVTSDDALQLEAVGQWTRRAEHDADAHRHYVELLLTAGQKKEATAAAEQLIWAGLGRIETHRTSARAFAAAGQMARADYEWESASLSLGADKVRRMALGEWASSLEARGQAGKAREVRKRIEALGAAASPAGSAAP